MQKLEGVFVITLTPFDAAGVLDEVSLKQLTEFYIGAGVNGLTILGIMGEVHKLTEGERLRVMDRVIETTRGRLPIVVGCSAGGTDVVAMLAQRAEEAGATAIMVAPPPGLRNEEMLATHFRRVAERISIPLVIQDEPVSTGVLLSPQFLARLVQAIPNARYIKLEEAPTTVKASRILALTGDRVGIFGGLGGQYFYEELGRGTTGIMTGFAYPEVLVETWRRFRSGDRDGAREWFYHHLPLIRFEAQLGVGGVTIRKEIFRLRGVIQSAHVRFPGISVDSQTLDEVRDLIHYLGLPLD